MNNPKNNLQKCERLTITQRKTIDKIDIPWQRNFLLRFYAEKYEQQLTSKDIQQKATEKSKLYPSVFKPEYSLSSSTLSQYTSFETRDSKSKQLRSTIQTDHLISIALALGVSVEYLLGIHECKTPKYENIYKQTGLTDKSIDALTTNKSLQKKMNILLSSPLFNEFLELLEKDHHMQQVQTDLLSHYSDIFIEKIEMAFDDFTSNTFPLDDSKELYETFLKKHFPRKLFTPSIEYFLKNNLSNDVFNDIQYQINTNRIHKDLYNLFITDTASRTYLVLQYKHYTRNVEIAKMHLSLEHLLDDYHYRSMQQLRNTIYKL